MRLATALIFLALFATVLSSPLLTRSADLRHDAPASDPAHAMMDKEDKEVEKPVTEDMHDGHDMEEHDKEEHDKEEHDHEGHDHEEHDKEEHDSHSEESHDSEGDSESSVAVPVAADTEEMPEPSAEADEGVCIGVSHLETFNSHELVFEKHVLARVLCDTAGSCATPGHIVNFKGSSMMMGRYCDIVGCEQKVMEVNSPRYQRGLKILSMSDDMHFTAFAARFETRGEEAVLAAAVRAGL